MKKSIKLLAFFIFIFYVDTYGQSSGNIAYQNNNYSHQRPTVELPTGNLYINDNSFFIEANVLINMKADEYVVTFSLNEEGKTIEEASKKIENKVFSFVSGLNTLGITKNNIYVDFITQNKIYGYDLKDKVPENSVIKERLVGFEVKKNILIRYKNEETLDKITTLASKSDIYDLVKVDYVVNDLKGVREKLFDEAVKVVNQKEANFRDKLGLKIRSSKQIHTLKYNSLDPSESYRSYQAAETNEVLSSNYRSYTIETARKNKTFFYYPIDSTDFDAVIEPVVTQPIVQYTILLKVQYKLDN